MDVCCCRLSIRALSLQARDSTSQNVAHKGGALRPSWEQPCQPRTSIALGDRVDLFARVDKVVHETRKCTAPTVKRPTPVPKVASGFERWQLPHLFEEEAGWPGMTSLHCNGSAHLQSQGSLSLLFALLFGFTDCRDRPPDAIGNVA